MHSLASCPRRRAHPSLSPIAAAVALAVSASAAAQTTLPTVQVTAPAEPVNVGESASPKFTAPLVETPKSVTVVPAAVIEQTGSTSLQDVLRTVPGISFGAGEGGNSTGDRPFIRGFDAQTDTYVDGLRDPGSQTREIFNIEQIEVIKGPSSAFGGRGSSGGAVNLVSKTPKARDFIDANVGLGTDRYRRATIDVNQSLTEDIAARLNLMAHDNHVAGRDAANYSRWGIAPSITFGMKSRTRATLGWYHMKTDDLPDAGGFPYDNPFAATSPNAALNGDGRPVVSNREAYFGLVDRDFQKTRADIGTIDVSHDFESGLVLRNVTRIGQTTNNYIWTQPDDSKGNPNLYGTLWRRSNTRAAETDTAANQTSLTGKGTLGGFKHSFNVGIEFSREKTERGTYTFSPGTNNPLTGNQACATVGAATNYNCTTFSHPNPYDPWAAGQIISRSPKADDVRVKTTTRSIYGFDTIDLSPQWALNLGLRFDDYSTSLYNPTAAGTAAAPRNLRNDASFLNYQAGVTYKLAPNGNVYLAYGTASTPPGTDAGDGADGLTAAIQNLKPQETKSVELGTKWELLDRAVLVTGAIFRAEMNNARVTAADGSTQNVGSKRVQGLELSVAGNIGKHWQVFGGYTFLDSELVDMGFASGAPSTQNGNKFPNTPKHSLSLWTTYAPVERVRLGLGAFYVDRQWGNTANTKWIPSWTRYDAMASYMVNRRLSFQLNVQNLTDKLYFTKAYASHYAVIAPGRTAILSANLKF